MKKKFVLLTLILTIGVLYVSCGDSSSKKESDDDITVGFVVKSLSDQYWIIVKAGAEDKAKELGVDLEFIAPNSESDVQSQVQMIEDLVAQSVDVLCVAPSSDDTVQSALKNADNAGIPVIAIDTDTSFEKKVSFIGTGNEDAAKLGTEFAAKEVGEGKKAVILRGRLGDSTHDDRVNGMKTALEEANIEILETKPADSESEKALNIMQDLLGKYDQIDLVVSTTDLMAQGAQRAIEEAGADTLVMGFDGTVDFVEMLSEGKFLGTTAQNPYNMGSMGVENAVEVSKGNEIEKRIDTGAEVINKDNAKEYLEKINSYVDKK